jgi:sulfur-oxidizing protein SoxA
MWASAFLAAFTAASGIAYQSDAVRAMQADTFGNPGLLWVDRGAELWKQKCAGCHGEPSSMNGVAARYPRHSTQLARVVDLEQRIQACLPGLAWESRDLLGLTAFVARQSNGIPISVDVKGLAAPAYERGRSLYFERQGQLNLACTHCHDANAGKTLLSEPISQGQPVDWPAYRLDWQSMGSLQRRLRACYFGVRAEMPPFGSDDLVALELYLADRAKGLAASVPGVRR